jgi:hypothetical protein
MSFKIRGNKVAGIVRHITARKNPFKEHSSELHLELSKLKSNLSYHVLLPYLKQYPMFEDARKVYLQAIVILL